MKRLLGWETAYVDVVTEAMARPFAWGAADCLTAPAELARRMCGVDVFPAELRDYRDEAGAMELLAELGFRDIGTALASVFTEVPVLMARRGDCGLIRMPLGGRTEFVTYVVLGDGRAVGKGVKGPVFVPTSWLERAFAIGELGGSQDPASGRQPGQPSGPGQPEQPERDGDGN